MDSPTASSVPWAALQRLLWAPQNSLASWASSAGAAVLDQLPAYCERSGYRHDVSTDSAGVVTHELIDLESSLPVCLVYERPDGSRIAGSCRPWSAILVRFVTAVIDGDLLIAGDDVGNALTGAR